MKIGIDARLYGTKHGGIGRYTAELVKNLEKVDSQNDYFIFLARNNFDEYQPQNSRFKKVSADFKVYGVFEQSLYPFLLYSYNLDLVHFTHFNVPLLYAKRYIVTIHDLIISHYPSSRATTLNPVLYRLKLFFYNFIVKSAASRAKQIIAVSQFTKDDIVRLLKVRPEKIAVVYEGVDLPAISDFDCPVVKRDLGIGDEFIMYVGSAYPHKNLEKLIEAFAEVAKIRPQLQLALAGKKNFFYQRLEEFANNVILREADIMSGDRGDLVAEEHDDLKHEIPTVASLPWNDNTLKPIIFTGYLPDEQIACLYKSALLYVFPSLIEGFGLPPLEAQSYGLPVASSDKTCLPEVLGDSALYFDPENVEDMVAKIGAALSDEELRASLRERGYENVKKYSWHKMAEEIKKLYYNS